MKRKINILKITTIFTAFTLGIVSFTGVFNKAPTRVEATPHLANYDPYYYEGNYYEDKDIDLDGGAGMNGTLRQDLTSKNRPVAFLTYGGYAVGDNLSTHLQKADEDPTNSSNMIYFYTRNSVAKTAANADANTIIWCREHVWPKSSSNGNWEGDTKGKQKAGTDILHLRPEYSSVNSSRGNTIYGDNNGQGEKKYEGMTYGYYPSGSGLFEPVDALKGDIARIIMYVWTTYTDYDGYSPIDILDVFESYDTLIKWHTMDKPDVLEGNRNDYCETKTPQGNRNPYVDHPELAWKVFGAEVEDQTILNNCVAAYPASGYVPVRPTSITLNENSLSLDINETFTLTSTLEPDGAVGTVTWTSSNTSVAMVNENGVVTAKGAGSATITARVSSTLSATCNVLVTASSDVVTSNIFEANLTNGTSITNGFSITYENVSSQSGFWQDKGTKDSSICYFMAKSNSPLFDNQPSQITLTATLGAGSTKNPLDHNVEAVFVDSSGNEITSTKTTVATSLQKDPHDIVVNLPYNANACGLKLMHMKEDSWNVRYYSFSLSYTYNVTVGPEAYLGSATAIKTIRGNASVTSQNKDSTITFKTAGIASGADITSVSIGDVTLNGAKGSNENGNIPKYYESGYEMRVYKGNTFTFASANNITRIEFTFTGGTATGLGVDSGTLSGNVWTGEGTSIVFSNNNITNTQIKIKAIQITTKSPVVSISSLDVRFGIKIATSAWDAVANNAEWTIQDYGVMMYLTTENKLSTAPEVSSRYNKNLDLDHQTLVSVGRRESGTTPATDGNGNYNFTVKVNIPSSSWYDYYFCVRPFIQINNEICWLLDGDLQESVRTLADSNNGTNFEPDVLSYLAGN